jgi:hypothetical protein
MQSFIIYHSRIYEAKVNVPNLQLQKLAAAIKPKKTTFAQLEFVGEKQFV